MRNPKGSFWRAGLIGLALVAAVVVASAEPVEVGESVPGFSLQTLSGGDVDLADRIAEGPVVLVFFRGVW